MVRLLIFICLSFAFVLTVHGQEEQDYYDLSLEELMQLKVSVASQKALTSRESPGIITIISETDIINSGARDLIDVLRLVPGLTFGYDVQGITGLAARGNWGHEGKILLLVDGQEMNDILYSTTQFGNHYDVTQIQRIEVIRGPGSSIYGGSAELGVINIITKSGEDLNGVELNGTYGFFNDTYARRNVSFAIGQSTEEIDFDLKGFIGEGQRSNQDFTDIFGNSNSMKGNSNLNPGNINAGIKYKDLHVRAIYDNYRTSSIAIYEDVVDTAQMMDFVSFNSQIYYKWKVSENLTLTPKFSYINQQPWRVRSDDDEIQSYYRSIDVNYDITAEKVTGNLTGNLAINENLNLLLGTEYFIEQASDQDPMVDDYFLGRNKIDFNTVSGFAEVLYQSKLGNMTVGTRFVNHSQYGSAFAPRIAYTKVINNFHAKVLYNRAYRAPSIENIITNPNLSPERTNVAEMELGLKLTDEMAFNLNFYDITIKNPIIYLYDDATIYENFDQSGSRGLELEYNYRATKGALNVNYSFNTSRNKNKVDLYEVESNNTAVVGIPHHKLNIISSLHLNKQITISPSFVLLGKRYAFTSFDETNGSKIDSIDPSALLNLNIHFENLVFHGLSWNIGVFDILNDQYAFIQPYDGFHSPLPGPGREIVLRLNYKFKSEKEE